MTLQNLILFVNKRSNNVSFNASATAQTWFPSDTAHFCVHPYSICGGVIAHLFGMVVILNIHSQIRFAIMSLSSYSLYYYSIYSKILFTIFHTKYARDNKKSNISYTTHMVY